MHSIGYRRKRNLTPTQDFNIQQRIGNGIKFVFLFQSVGQNVINLLLTTAYIITMTDLILQLYMLFCTGVYAIFIYFAYFCIVI